MTTLFNKKRFYRPEGFTVTTASYYAEGVNEVSIVSEIFMNPADSNSKVRFWISPSASGDVWIGPFGTEYVAGQAGYMTRADSRGPGAGYKLYTSGPISLGNYTGVIRLRTQVLSGNQALYTPVIYDVKLRNAQRVVNNDMPPRYYWMRNDIVGESNDLGVDEALSSNYAPSSTRNQGKLVLSNPELGASIQSLTHTMVNPVDVVTLEANFEDSDGLTAQLVLEDMRDFLPAYVASVPSVTYSGNHRAVLITHQSGSSTSLLNRRDLRLSGDFDITLDFNSVFGNYASTVGEQKAGIQLYFAPTYDAFDGSVHDYLKCFIADDGKVYSEKRLGNGEVSLAGTPRRDTNSQFQAVGKIRLLRRAGKLHVFYRPNLSTNQLTSDGAFLVDSLDWADDLFMAFFSEGPVGGGSDTVHLLSVSHRLQRTIPQGIDFEVSNDNGSTWKTIIPGVPAYLEKTGNNLKWRVNVAAGSGANLDIRNLSLRGASYALSDFGSVNVVTPSMKSEAAAASGKTFVRYMYWQSTGKSASLIFFDDELRESTTKEALMAKVVVSLDAIGVPTVEEVINYKNKVYLSEQGILYHQAYRIESERHPDGFFVETPFRVTETAAVSGQSKSGKYKLELIQAVDAQGNDIDGEVSVKWNGTYLNVGGLTHFPFASIASNTYHIFNPEAGDLTFEVGSEMPPTLPRQDVLWVIDSQPSASGVQEQITLNWGRRPSVVTVFDGHPDTKVILNTISHEGFTTDKRGGFDVGGGNAMTGFWRVETQW